MWLKTGNVYFNYHAGQGNIGRTMVCTISTPIASSGQDDAAFVAIWIGAGGVPVLLLALLIVWRCFRRARQTEPDVDGPSAAVIGGKATLRTDSKELVHPLNEMAMKSLPKYWTGCRESGSDEVNVRDHLGFAVLMYVKHEHMGFFLDLEPHVSPDNDARSSMPDRQARQDQGWMPLCAAWW